MANALYDSARQKFLEGGLAWLSDTIKIVMIDTGAYTFSAAHTSLSDVAAGARIGTPQTLTNKTSTAGVADADDVTFTAVASGAYGALEAILIYKDTGVAGTSYLIAYIDTATGLPVTPNGGDIIVAFDSGSNKIFRI